MRIATLGLFLVTVMFGSGVAADDNLGATYDGLDRLAKQEGRFQTTLIHPEVDFSEYSKLCPQTVTLQFREVKRSEHRAATGSIRRKRTKRSATPAKKDLTTFKQVASDAIAQELQRSGEFELVEQAGPETLLVRAAVVDIVSTIPPRSKRGRKVAEPFVAEGIIVFDLIDAESGAIVARIGERRSCEGGASTAPESTDGEKWLWSSIDAWFERAAADLRHELERVRTHELPDEAEGTF